MLWGDSEAGQKPRALFSDYHEPARSELFSIKPPADRNIAVMLTDYKEATSMA